MLTKVRQEAIQAEKTAARRREWFHSADGDLYVWTGPDDRVLSFQISCFDAGDSSRREWWLEWTGRGLRSGRVDSKEVDSREHDLKSPMVEPLAAETKEAARRVLSFLDREGGALPAGLRAFLRERLGNPAS